MGQIYQAIAKAEGEVKKKLAHTGGAVPEVPGRPIPESLEAVLAGAGLGPEQIERQTLAELRETLLGVEAVLADPLSWLQEKGYSAGAAGRMVAAGFSRIMLGRKCLVISRIDYRISQSKIQKLRHLVDEVGERRVRTAMQRELNELEAKNELVQAEFRALNDSLERCAQDPDPGRRPPPAGAGESA
jgi:hypothetical protein